MDTLVQATNEEIEWTPSALHDGVHDNVYLKIENINDEPHIVDTYNPIVDVEYVYEETMVSIESIPKGETRK